MLYNSDSSDLRIRTNVCHVQTYRRVRSRPSKVPRSEHEEEEYNITILRKEQEVSEAFLSYLSSKGVFEDWEKNKETFQRVHVSVSLIVSE